MADQIWRAV